MATPKRRSAASTPIRARDASGGPRFALVHAAWHADIVARAVQGFIAEMARHGVASDAIDAFEVPGAFEIPLLARRLARSGRYGAVGACALVVDGGIYRHDFVARSVVEGLMQVQLETDVPVLSVVLTPHHFHEHAEHRGFFAAHFVRKGEEAARAALQAIAALQAVPSPA